MARTVLAVGDFRHERLKGLEVVAHEAAAVLDVVATLRQANAWLAEHPADALLVERDTEGVADFCVALRAQAEFSQVAVLALCRKLDDLCFEEVFGWGADDAVVWANRRGLVRRLRALHESPRRPPPSGRGTAVIADPGADRRVILGRLLRNAGFAVTFATNADDAERFACARTTSLVVGSTGLIGGVRRLLERARASGSTASWIVTAPPMQVPSLRLQLGGFSRVAVTDGYAPADNVLFVANDLASGAANQRASQRMLYGTRVLFRPAGHENDEQGFTYNVSESGLYVRTLAPPDDTAVWLELRAPRCERMVRLEGRVAWRRLFGPIDRATVPPGFGVALMDGSRADLEAWRAGCLRYGEVVGCSG